VRVLRVDDEPEYGVALGSVLVSLLEPAPGRQRAFHRWYERDHFYAGCMSGPHFFAGRRFVATRSLRDLRDPAGSRPFPDASAGSCLALYWIERDHGEEAERWAVERVLWLGENGRMQGGGDRTLVHASFYAHRFAAGRDADGVPPEVALDHPFPGLALWISQRPPGVSLEEREGWLLGSQLPGMLAGSGAALCLSLAPRGLPESSPVWTPPEEGADRRSLELFFLEGDPRREWGRLAGFGAAQRDAGMGEVLFASPFVPTIPGTDRYVDEL